MQILTVKVKKSSEEIDKVLHFPQTFYYVFTPQNPRNGIDFLAL